MREFLWSFIFSAELHLQVSWFMERQTLQLATLSTADKVTTNAVSRDRLLDEANFVDLYSSKAGIREVFAVVPDGYNLYTICNLNFVMVVQVNY